MNQKDYKKYLEALGPRESSGNYSIESKDHFLGMYQLGEAALIEAGYYKKNTRNYNNDWTGKFTGVDGVYSKKHFLNNPKAQEKAVRKYHKKVWGYIKNNGYHKYIGKTIDNVHINESALLSGFHLKGFELAKFLESGGKTDPADKNRTKVSSYMKEFGGYDISEITENKATSVNVKATNAPDTVSKTAATNKTKDPLRQLLETQKIDFADAEQKLFGKAPKSGESPKVNMGMLQNQLNYQNDRKQSFLDQVKGLEKRFHGKVPDGYVNEELKSAKVFTREDISSMTNKEKMDNKKAIDYQKNTIGIPTKQQASSSGMVFVNGYTRSDGTQVKSYYRAR
jgi:hypothetical protein